MSFVLLVKILRSPGINFLLVAKESFDDFVTNLKKLSQDCEFGTLCDSLIRDVIIIGILDNRVRERLLREHDLTLENTIKHCKVAEETKQHTKILHHLHSKKAAVRAVKKKPPQKDKQAKANDYLKNCKFCAGSHKRGHCPAFSKKCKSCKKTGHFAKCCPKQKSINHVQKGHTSSQSADNDEEEDDFFTGSIEVEVEDTPIINDDSNCYSLDDDDVTATVMSIDGDDHSVNFSEWSVVLNTNGSNINYKIDSGAQVNILPRKEFYSLQNRSGLKDTKIKLKAYNGSSVPVLGRCVAQVKHKNRTVQVLFIVADTTYPPILGLATSENLNLIKRVLNIDTTDTDFLTEFSDCFGQISFLPGTHHIVLKDNMTPFIHAPRRVPVALRPKLKEELK